MDPTSRSLPTFINNKLIIGLSYEWFDQSRSYIIIYWAERMAKPYHRSVVTYKQDSFLKTMHQGFNYFHEIEFSSKKKAYSKIRPTHKRAATSVSEKDDHKSLQVLLTENKEKFTKIKTELNSLREFQVNDYVKKSLKYQEILNLNDNKKKRLPTLNTKIGEVVKKSAVESIAKNIEYTMINTAYKSEGWRPESREGHTCTIYKNYAIIIGGHCSFPYSIAQVYSFDRQAWIRHFDIFSARSYHTSIFYKNRFIIVFGGMGTYDVSRKCRICFNTINLIDLQTWSSRSLKMNNEETIQGRRSHGAVLMGKYMLVIGGMNTKRQFLNDFIYLDLKELRWYHKQYKIQGKQLNDNMQTGLAKHKIVSSFKSSHKNFPLYSSEYSDHQGMLIFGGSYGNGQENIILFMGFNKYNPYLKRVDYSGIPPSSIQPIVQKINENAIAIISGDLNDRNIRLYRIKQRQFVGIYKFIGSQFYGGIGSTISKHDDDIYIFFGLTKKGYNGNINSFKIEEKIVEGETKKKKERNNSFDEKVHKDVDSESQSISKF